MYFNNFTNERKIIVGLSLVVVLLSFLLISKSYSPALPVNNNGEVVNNPQNSTTTPVIDDDKNTENKETIIDKIINIIPKPSKNNNSNPTSLKNLMAWIYPGEPACSAFLELKDGRVIDTLKIEYFKIGGNGELMFLDEENHGCNAYSQTSVNTVKQYSKEQYVTVSSLDSNLMATFLQHDSNTNEYTDKLVNFVVSNGLTGIEIDFEDFGGWDKPLYAGFKSFVERLGNELHRNGKKLIVDGPAVSNEIEEKWYVWRYEDFKNLPVDYVLVMAYDYQFDHGVGEPVAPIDWVEKVIDWTVSKFPDRNRLVIGVPSYGYYGTIGQNRQIIVTYNQISKYPGFDTAKRDEKSGEMMWTYDNKFYVYQDSESINKKVNAILNKGIGNVSVWHLGGNKWLSQ